MKNIGSGLIGTVGFGTSSSQGVQPSAGFEELAMPLFDSLYNFARWLVHGTNDAEDLVQETYLKGLRSFASFQPGTNFRAWIFQILRNTFLSSRSKLERRMTVAMDSEEDGTELAVDTETPETILIHRSNSQLVRRAVDDLPVQYRETLLLCEVEEMSYQEIAEILSIPIGTVMSRLARARKAVRESLLSAPSAPLSRDLSHHTETHEEGTGPHREIGFEGIDQDQFVPNRAKAAFPVGWFHKRATNLR
jgi:RNA polymerase sigma factor (sigma-70 family)